MIHGKRIPWFSEWRCVVELHFSIFPNFEEWLLFVRCQDWRVKFHLKALRLSELRESVGTAVLGSSPALSPGLPRAAGAGLVPGSCPRSCLRAAGLALHRCGPHAPRTPAPAPVASAVDEPLQVLLTPIQTDTFGSPVYPETTRLCGPGWGAQPLSPASPLSGRPAREDRLVAYLALPAH